MDRRLQNATPDEAELLSRRFGGHRYIYDSPEMKNGSNHGFEDRAPKGNWRNIDEPDPIPNDDSKTSSEKFRFAFDRKSKTGSFAD
jgi:hypothetical protein